MRVVCVQPAAEPVVCAHRTLRLGSAAGNEVRLRGAAVSPQHASISADARGWVLQVQAAEGVYVNARRVRERALLRRGDSLTVGSNQLLLTSDVAPPPAPAVLSATTESAAAGVAALRVLSGADAGCAIPIAATLELGAGTAYFAGLRQRVRLTWVAGALVFECRDGVAMVNGWRCSHARLADGDQLVLADLRLLVEAPGLAPPATVAAPQATPASRRGPAIADEIRWLLAAAAGMALLIAALLYFDH